MNPTPTGQSIEQILEQILDDIFEKLNGSGAHACYCKRSTDGGCECALKDAFLAEAKQALTTLMQSVCEEVIPAKPSNELINQALQNGKPQQAASYNGYAAAVNDMKTNLAQLLNGKDITKDE